MPNLLIKVAATDAGITAIEELTARGVSVNVTLLFSLRRYEQAIDAYWSGLERRLGTRQADRRKSPRWPRSSSRASTRSSIRGSRRTRPCAGGSRSQTPRSPTRATCAPSRRARWKDLAVRGATTAAPAVGEHRHEGPRLLRRPLRPRADRPRCDQHGPDRRRFKPLPTMVTSAARSAATRPRPAATRRAGRGRYRLRCDHGRARAPRRRLLPRFLSRAVGLYRGEDLRGERRRS